MLKWSVVLGWNSTTWSIRCTNLSLRRQGIIILCYGGRVLLSVMKSNAVHVLSANIDKWLLFNLSPDVVESFYVIW